MLLDLVNRISSERKVKKILDIQVWVLSRSSRGRPENVLGTSRINLLETSFERQIKTSPGRQFRTSPGRLIGTSPWRSNRIFRGRPGDVGGGRPRDVLGTNICRLGKSKKSSGKTDNPLGLKRFFSCVNIQDKFLAKTKLWATFYISLLQQKISLKAKN